MNITKAVVERADSPQQGQNFIRDDQLTGFALRTTAAGVKSFVWEGRIKGRVRRLTLGQYPALTVLQARKKALDIKARVARGEDPADEREAERREFTFGETAAAYIEQHARPHKRSWERDQARLTAHFAHWKTRRLSDVSRAEVVKLQHEMAERHGRVASNRAIVLLRALFNWAAANRGFTGDNPAAGVKLFAEQKRERFLNADELRRVNESLLQEANPYWRVYFPLVLMLGTRKTELLSARWVDVDLEQQTIRLPETKAGRSHLLPLPAVAADMLRSLPSRNKSEWLFPSSGKSGHLVEVKSSWQRIRTRAGVQNITVHDLRRTLGSWMAARGASLPLIGKTLGHKSVAATQIYARLDLSPVREALEANAEAMGLSR